MMVVLRWASGQCRWYVLLLLAGILVLDVASMRHLTPTYDEPAHLRYGQQLLDLDSTRFDDSKMPFSALNAIPARLATALGLLAPADTAGPIRVGRFVTVAFSLLTASVVFRWARDLYGPAAGLLSLALYAFDPNLLAHSQLVTTDMYAAGMTTLALYAFWRFLKLGGRGRAAASALVLGLSQLSKYTATALFPLFVLIALGWHSPDLWRLVRERRGRELARRALVLSRFALLFVVVSLAVINAGFLFNHSFTRLGDYHLRSRRLSAVQAAVGNLRIPVPYPYFEGLDWVRYHERTGEFRGRNYLLGQLRSGSQGFAGYYFYACLFKLPIATLLVVLATVGVYLARRRFDALRDEWVLFCPILFFTVHFNFFYRAQIGIRHFLVVLPLLFIFCGSLLERPASLPRPARAALAVALVYLVGSVLSYYPHFLSYFNELVWDRRQAYRILADSNIDWGQDGWYLEQYRAAHPDVIVNPPAPTAGTIVVNVNALTGIIDPEGQRWLRENFQPVDRVAYSWLVFRVSPDDLERIERPRR
jgi:4-amino-4-deoxy-L-arabinose transferase-like glycosyltransferase